MVLNILAQYPLPALHDEHCHFYLQAMFQQTVVVNVHDDGSIEVNHSGIEVGQGINTKVEQAVAYEFNQIAPVCPSSLHARF